MQYSKDDFLVIKDERKFRLVKVVEASNDGELVVRREESKVEGKRTTETISDESVVLNLGSNPPAGTVYGCKIEPFQSSSDLDGWGTIHYYREVEREDKKTIKKAAAKVWKRLDKERLTAFAPLTVEVRLNKGSEIGYYKIHKSQETDVLCIKPKEFDQTELTRLFFHEAGHGIMDRMMPSNFRAKWVTTYAYYTSLKALKKDDLIGIRALVEGNGSLKQVEDVDPDHLDACIGSIIGNFGIRKADIELLLNEGVSLEAYWPKHTLDLPDNEVPLTDYAMKSVDEFWCEAFAMHMTGTQLPKRIRNLMLKTLNACKE